jgi:hypothetical protein
MRGKITLAGIALGLAALAAPVALPAAASNATTATRLPYFTEWRPGTPLPKIPSGYELFAWPPQQVLAGLKPGATVPAVRVVRQAHMARAYRRLENPAGIVNLDAVPETPGSCVPGLPQFLNPVSSVATNVMQSYSTIKGAKQTFTYGLGQSTTVGVGASGSGDPGTYAAAADASASVTDAGSTQQGFAPQKGRSFNHFQTYFEWGKYYVANSCPQEDAYQIMPYEWNAGTNYVHPKGAPGATHCTPEHNGDWLTQNKTVATTFKVGFTVLGFSGTAQTGYSTTASIRFDFYQTGQLCGVKATPPNRPGILVAS